MIQFLSGDAGLRHRRVKLSISFCSTPSQWRQELGVEAGPFISERVVSAPSMIGLSTFR